jgi:WD40 repeat protein
VAFHPASKRVVTGSWDGEVRVWNAEDAKGMLTFTAAPGLPAVAVAK